ncbi:MAG: hypothetical protein CR982_01375 [Candidatus Cloacimonadota bacterium]|nr:MAG: hypothetical protein CR982_01375 [Candidatus Cloacimonadota bacterium]PIE79576.1 MAG: hypothetical protein CSA15_02850 [Candidatus Delongbacteria bacterium]
MRKGVTLIEVLVAISILTMGITGILYSLPKYSSIVYGNNYKREAYLILQTELEFYLNKGAKLIEEDLADTSLDGDDKRRVVVDTFKTTNYGAVPYKLVVSAQRKVMDMQPAEATNNKFVTPYYLDLTAKISWKFNGKADSVELENFYGYSDLNAISGTT